MVNRIEATENLDGQRRPHPGSDQPNSAQANERNGLGALSRIPGAPSVEYLSRYNPPVNSTTSTLEKIVTNPQSTIKKRSFLVQWFCNLPIGRKQAMALLACELVPIIGFGVGATLVLTNSLRTQVIDQAKSEVAVAETNYSIKINQMGFGARGQADNLAIISAAKSWKRGEPVRSDAQNQLKQILKNEVKARKIEYATLVGKDLRIIANANNNRQGETFNPDDLVSKVLKTPQQIKANGIVSWKELTKEGASIPAGLANKDALIRYVVSPVKDPDTNEVIGAFVFGDIVNEKLPIVENTLKSLRSGYSAVYLRQANGEFALSTGLEKTKDEDLSQAQRNVPLPSTLLLAAAAEKNGEPVTERMVVDGHPYTMAAVAVPNQITETPDGPATSFNGKPIAILVRGTSEDGLNSILWSNLLQEAIVLAAGIAAILLWTAIFRKAVLRPLKHLEKGTQDFASGDRSARVQVFSLDEVGQLSLAFNEMANNIVEAEAILGESFKNQERQAKQAELLNRVITRIRQTLDFDSVVQTGVDEVRDFLKSDRVLIYTFDPGWVSGTVTAESVGPGWIKAIGKKIEDPLVDGAIDRYNSGRIWYTNNIYQDQLSHCHCQILEQLQVKANIVAPIKMEGRLIGLLCAHQCSGPRDWQPSEIDLFGQLAAQIGYALDQAILLKRQENIAYQARQINKITDRLRQSLDREHIHTTVVRELREAMSVDRVVVYLFDEKWQGRVVAESVGRGFPAALGADIADPCFALNYVEKYKRGRVQALSNIYEAQLDPCYMSQLEPFEVKANIVAPILVNDNLLGLLVAHQCSAPREWQEVEINLLRQIAIQLGFALEQATLFEQREQARLRAELISQDQRQQKEMLQKLNNITTHLRQSMNREQLNAIVVRELREALSVDRVVVYLFNEKWQGRVVAESVGRGFPAALGANIADPCFALNYVEKYKQGRVQALSNIYEVQLDPCYLSQLEPFEVKANIVAPIIFNKQLLGLLVAHECSAPREWQEVEINLLRQAAIQLGFALEQASLLEQQEGKAKFDRLLSDVTISMRQTLVREDILKTVAKEMRKALDADRVVIYLFNSDRTGTVYAESVVRGYKSILGETVTDPFREGLIDEYRDGRVRVMHDVYAEELSKCHVELLEGFEIRASMTGPILEGDRLLGLLCVHQCSGPREWNNLESNFFKRAAFQLGFSLEQATLLEQREQSRVQAELISQEQRQQKEVLQMQLVELLSEVEGASRGDLTVRADVTVGEIGTVADFFNSIVESLRQIVTQVKQSAIQVNAALGENDGAVRQLADEAMKQAEEATLTLQSIEQMTQSIQSVADSASLAAQVTRTASATAQAGGTAMDLTVQNILSLRETIGETAKKVKRLGESSQKISKVVSLINQIALQTNLLAINAGIEAARAGEEGQGFAVVAEEVGELAARSAAATQEIEQIVENIQRETNEVVEAMEQGTTQVVEGTHLVENAKESLEQILEVSHQIDQLVQSISDATVSQVQTSQTITQLMEEVASIASRTSNSSRQVSQSLRETVEIAHELQESVGAFKVG